MCTINVVNRTVCLIFFLKGIGSGFRHPGHPLATTLQTAGGAENDGHEIAGHEIDGPSCRA